MTEPVATRLWTQEGFCEDEWHHGEGVEALEGNGRVILPLAVVLGLDRAALEAARERLGVLLMPADPVEKIAPLLDHLSLVALAFPTFNDGRSFSNAQLLRTRHGYSGAVRATGQILVDQLPHMLRVGFSQFEVTNPVLIRRLEEGRAGGLGLYYQPAAQAERNVPGYSWRRLPAAS